jgi:hypothetical protein
MNTWTFRALMFACFVSVCFSAYDIATYKPPQELCLNNIVMIKHEDMYKQKGLWAQHCVAISKD